MSKATKFTLHVNEQFTGAKALVDGSCGFGSMRGQAHGTCERLFGMSETELNRIVGRLEGAAEALEKNSEKQAFSIRSINKKIDSNYSSIDARLDVIYKEFDERLNNIENMVAGAKWVKWLLKVIVWPVSAFVFYHADSILNILRSFIKNYTMAFILLSSSLMTFLVFLSPIVLKF